MNQEDFSLHPMKIRMSDLKSTLYCFLHTIAFNRSLGPSFLEPRDCYCAIFDISYSCSRNKCLDQIIRAQINALYNNIKRKEKETKSSIQYLLVSVNYYVNVQTKKSGWISNLFTDSHKKVYWETWKIPIQLYTTSQHNTEHDANIVRSNLMYIVYCISHNIIHVPPLLYSSSKTNCFPFEIEHKTSNNKKTTSSVFINIPKQVFRFFKHILIEGPPKLKG